MVRSPGNGILKGTWTFDLDNGVQGAASGAELWWEQVNATVRFLVPQSGAMVCNLGVRNFGVVSLQTLQGISYSALPNKGTVEASNRLTPGTIIGIHTNAARYAKWRINRYGYNVNIDGVTYQ